MKVLIACEYSGIVRDAFTRHGHDAISCDILPTESYGAHYCGDVRDMFSESWDLIVAHPPCTRLTNAGNRWYTDGPYVEQFTKDREEAIAFFQLFQNLDCPRIAIENPQPSPYVTSRVGKYTQKIQPWQFGRSETKGICLWLKGLPPLMPTLNCYPKMMSLPYKERAKVHSMAPDKDRAKKRSLFFPEVAEAMATQWGSLLEAVG